MEGAQVSMDRRMDKRHVVWTHNGVLLGIERKEMLAHTATRDDPEDLTLKFGHGTPATVCSHFSEDPGVLMFMVTERRAAKAAAQAACSHPLEGETKAAGLTSCSAHSRPQGPAGPAP